MNTYKIFNKHTGIDLGTYKGSNEDIALDRMARDIGYEDYLDLTETVSGAGKQELEIYEL